MKKLLTLIIVASLALTIQAQDITNTLGIAGEFDVKNSNNDVLFKIHNTGFGANSAEFEFNSHSGGSTLVHIKDVGHGNKLYFDFARIGPASVESGDDLGTIYFNGYSGSAYQFGASIIAKVSGTVSHSTVPTELIFATQHTGSLTDRMTIKSDGTVNIADLAGGSNDDYVTVDVNGNLKRSATVPPTKAPINNQIQQLKEENVAMKAEMTELRKMLEILMEEK